MSSSAINQGVLSAKISNVQNVGDSSAVCSTTGDWSFKNATATATNVFISNAGNVGINATSPTSRLTIGTGTFTAAAAQTTGMYTNGANGLVVLTDAMSVNSRTGTNFLNIDASGNLLVGTTNSSTSVGVGLKFISDATHPYMAYVSNTSSNANTTYHLYSSSAGVFRFYVSTAGNIYATNTSVQPIASDRNLKQDIVDFDKGLSEVLKMKPRYFAYKKEPETKHAGFIAQEMDEALPGAMVDSLSKTEEGEQPFKTYQVDWHPLLVKAIQELSAKVEEQSLRLEAQAAEIEALKASAVLAPSEGA